LEILAFSQTSVLHQGFHNSFLPLQTRKSRTLFLWTKYQ